MPAGAEAQAFGRDQDGNDGHSVAAHSMGAPNEKRKSDGVSSSSDEADDESPTKRTKPSSAGEEDKAAEGSPKI